MSEIIIYFRLLRDYRHGSELIIDDEEDEEDFDQHEIELEKTGEDRYSLYIVASDCGPFTVFKEKYFDDLDMAEKYSLKLFAQKHDCLPFVVTGTTSAYHDKGYYPKVPEDIESMEEIDFEVISGEHTFVIVLDNKYEDVVYDLVICPM
ncbi:unnamed protein product [marine sediment metagenome]|uniref:Uncharacterized protein n=1 Tax=marine sediment metagenome TaxID=412755 RepID=X1EA59_9ZZZZ